MSFHANTHNSHEIEEFLTATMVTEVANRLKAEGKTGANFDFFSATCRILAATHLTFEIRDADIELACDNFGWVWEKCTVTTDITENTIFFT